MEKHRSLENSYTHVSTTPSLIKEVKSSLVKQKKDVHSLMYSIHYQTHEPIPITLCPVTTFH